MHPCRVADIRWLGQKCRTAGHKWQHVINRRLRVLPTCPEWLCLSRRARDTAATMLHHPRVHHSKHRGESATKTVKFFVTHTVNYVICNNHIRIDWVLLYFTPVFSRTITNRAESFVLSKSETRQFRSDLVFDIIDYAHLIFFHGG